MPEVLSFNPLDHPHEVVSIQTEAWGFSDLEVMPPHVLYGLRAQGHLAAGVFDEGALLGIVVGIAPCPASPERFGLLHALCVRSRTQGLGRHLLAAAKVWATDLGLAGLWLTFDPLLTQNANLFLRHGGGQGVGFLPDFYGALEADRYRGFPTHRLKVVLPLGSPVGHPGFEGQPVLLDPDGKRASGDPGAGGIISIPGDFLALKQGNPEEAMKQHHAVCGILADLMPLGRIVGFRRRDRGCEYLWARNKGEF